MALTGLEIYKQLPETNCKEGGFPTCLAFAMKMAAGQVALDKCPHVTDEAKAALESASRPPIQLVTIGTGEAEIKIHDVHHIVTIGTMMGEGCRLESHIVAMPGAIIGNYTRIQSLKTLSGKLPDKSIVM